MLRPVSNPEAIAPLLFLQGVFESEGIDFSAINNQVQSAITRGEILSHDVAGEIINLLKEGYREFPTLDVLDPSENIEVPTTLVPQYFREVTRKNLLTPRPGDAHVEHEARVNIVSPYRDHPDMYHSLGALVISTHPHFDTIDQISLNRDGSSDKVVRTDLGFTDDPETLALLKHTNDYLGLI